MGTVESAWVYLMGEMGSLTYKEPDPQGNYARTAATAAIEFALAVIDGLDSPFHDVLPYERQACRARMCARLAGLLVPDENRKETTK